MVGKFAPKSVISDELLPSESHHPYVARKPLEHQITRKKLSPRKLWEFVISFCCSTIKYWVKSEIFESWNFIEKSIIEIFTKITTQKIPQKSRVWTALAILKFLSVFDFRKSTLKLLFLVYIRYKDIESDSIPTTTTVVPNPNQNTVVSNDEFEAIEFNRWFETQQFRLHYFRL